MAIEYHGLQAVVAQDAHGLTSSLSGTVVQYGLASA